MTNPQSSKNTSTDVTYGINLISSKNSDPAEKLFIEYSPCTTLWRKQSYRIMELEVRTLCETYTRIFSILYTNT